MSNKSPPTPSLAKLSQRPCMEGKNIRGAGFNKLFLYLGRRMGPLRYGR